MIPLYLKITGFLSYRDPAEVDFTTFHLACISGSNGAGKSSLLDAITWALFGQARRRDESLINLQSEAAEVIFTFTYENNLYRVLRALPRGKTSLLEFHTAVDSDPGAPLADRKVEWHALTERGVRETQKAIEKILRLDYETFINVSFFLQGKADQFAQQPPPRRKEILASILGLEEWEVYKERAAANRREINSDLDKLGGRIEEIERELKEEEPRKQRLKELTDQLTELVELRKTQAKTVEMLKKAVVSQLAEKKARLESERSTLQRREKEAAQASARLTEFAALVTEEEQKVRQAEAKVELRSKTETSLNELRVQMAALKAENEALKAQMDELKERIDRLEAAEGAVCPLCGQSLSEEHRRSTLDDLQGEGNEKGDRFRKNRTKMEDLTGQAGELELTLASTKNADKERLEGTSTLSQLAERIEAARQMVEEWQKTAAPRLKEIEEILAREEYTAEAPPSTGDVKEAEGTLTDLQLKENLKNQEVGEARQKVTVLASQHEARKKLEAERENLALQAGRYRTLERAFGKDGVPALLVEQALPELETKANELLDRLSNGSMSVRFVTQAAYKAKKREDLRETLEIQISDGAGVRDYELYSGGEAFRANFAIRLSLSEVLASRKGARLQMLVIDEGFGSQDAEGRQRLIQSIRAVQDDFAKVLVITHLDELKDAFPSRIEVEKGERGSTIRVA